MNKHNDEKLMADVKKRINRIDARLSTMTPFLEGMAKSSEKEESALRYRGMQMEAIRKQFADMHISITEELTFIRSLIQGTDYGGQSKEVVEHWIAHSVSIFRKILDNVQAGDNIVVLELDSHEKISIMKMLESPIAKAVSLTAHDNLEHQITDPRKTKPTPKGTVISKPIKHLSQVSNNSNKGV